MPRTVTAHEPLRRAYQNIYGVIEHSQWLKIKREMAEAGLALNKSSVEFYAKFKQYQPKKKLTKDSLELLNKFVHENQGIKTQFSGTEIDTLITEKTGYIPKSELYRSFHKAKLSFAKDKYYSFDETYQVLTFAYTYQPATNSKDKRYAS